MKVKMKVKTLCTATLLALSSMAAAGGASAAAMPPAHNPHSATGKVAHAATGKVAHAATMPSATSAAVPSATSTAAPSAAISLTLRQNHLLSQDIDGWAKAQGLHPLWNSHRDYLIFSTIYLHGKTRDEVLDQLGQLFRSENYGLVIRLYEKNNVLVIDSQ